MNEKTLGLILVLLVIGSTLVLIETQEKQQFELRKAAFSSMDRLSNDPLTVEEAEGCAVVIHQAVKARAVTYPELGAGSCCTIEEMVKHVQWGVRLEWEEGN